MGVRGLVPGTCIAITVTRSVYTEACQHVRGLGPEHLGAVAQGRTDRPSVERARQERAEGFFSWLGLHPWVWVLFVLAAASSSSDRGCTC